MWLSLGIQTERGVWFCIVITLVIHVSVMLLRLFRIHVYVYYVIISTYNHDGCGTNVHVDDLINCPKGKRPLAYEYEKLRRNDVNGYN